jgi:hypothetical protein
MAKNKETTRGEYVVGYGRPPTHTRFRKGQSGNPRGRPKRTPPLPDLKTMLINALNSIVVINENQRARQTTKYETAIMQIVNNAASGKIQFVKLLVELCQILQLTRQPSAPETQAAEESASERIEARLNAMRDAALRRDALVGH